MTMPDDGSVQSLVGYQLRRAHTLFALHWRLGFRADGPHVTPVQGGMLLSIDREPGMTQVALARIMDVEGPTLMEAVERLVANGLVQRVRRAEDRRSYALFLTEAGRAAVAAVRRFVPEREAELLADLSPEERRTLGDLLRRVVQRAQSVIADDPPVPAPAPPRLQRKPQD